MTDWLNLQAFQAGGGAAILSIVLFSYLLEDGALVMAGLLASAGVLTPPTAWAAAFVGIFTGDLGVYLVARVFRKPVSGWRPDLPAPTTRELVMCRFTPGTRTLAYGWSGLSKMSLRHFAIVVFLSGLAWTIPVFGLVYVAGGQAKNWLGLYSWIAIPALIATLWWWRGRPAYHAWKSR